jgi:hypothetical protein
MHYLKFIKYESGGYGFANKWVIGKFLTKKNKEAFKKIYPNSIPLTEIDVQKEIEQYENSNPLKKELEIHEITLEKKLWKTTCITTVKQKEPEESL